MRKFKLKIANTDYWVWVMIYDTLEELRAAAIKHDDAAGVIQQQKGGGADGFYSKTLGVTHRFERNKFDAEGEQVLYPNIGIIRLATGHMQTFIVSHELVHAVMWAYRLKFNHGNMGRKYGSLWREEYYAHMYGDTFSMMTRILHKKGIWF